MQLGGYPKAYSFGADMERARDYVNHLLPTGNVGFGITLLDHIRLKRFELRRTFCNLQPGSFSPRGVSQPQSSDLERMRPWHRCAHRSIEEVFSDARPAIAW
jgi:hypothetical protein